MYNVHHNMYVQNISEPSKSMGINALKKSYILIKIKVNYKQLPLHKGMHKYFIIYTLSF